MIRVRLFGRGGGYNFNSFIKPCVLPTEFCHGRGKMDTGSFLPGNLPTYEFYNMSFVAHQFGLGQLPLRLFFKDILRPREDISEVLEASRVFHLDQTFLPFACMTGSESASLPLFSTPGGKNGTPIFSMGWSTLCVQLWTGNSLLWAGPPFVCWSILFQENYLMNSFANCFNQSFSGC